MPRRPFRYDPARDYYALLGVSPAASAAEIQRAFRQRAKQLHPDRNPDRQAWATAAFQAINEAYAVLSDPVRRREYDALRWPHAAQTQHHADHAWWDESRHWDGSRRDSAGPGADRPDDLWRYAPGRIETRGVIQTFWTLLHGPYGGVLRLALVLCLLLPLSYTAITVTVSQMITAATPQLPAAAGSSSGCDNPAARITSPAEGAVVPAVFRVLGSADGPTFAVYRVELAYLGLTASGSRVRQWTTLDTPSRQAVQEGTLVSNVDLSAAPPGYYALRLTVWQADGSALPVCERRVVYRR